MTEDEIVADDECFTLEELDGLMNLLISLEKQHIIRISKR